MADFDGYKQAQKEQNMEFQTRKEQQSDFLQKGDKTVEPAQQLIKRYESKYTNPEEFAERTRHYFKDASIGDLNAENYEKLSGDTQIIENYSAMYTNNWASKRKSKAVEASENFKTMGDKMRKYSQITQQSSLGSLEKFTLQEEIMNYRYKGMSAAAVVKSKSSAHEDYMKCKSKLSCSMVLQDQLEHLMESEKDPAVLEQLQKKHDNLVKTIDNAQQQLLKMYI